MIRRIMKQTISGFAMGTLVLFTVSPAVLADNATVFTAANSAVTYLATQQKADGHIDGYGGESDWTAIALQANGTDSNGFAATGGVSLVNYLTTTTSSSDTTTALERHILALAATGQDMTNSLAQLGAAYTGGQIGDPTLLNDDIFGILAIAAAKDAALLPAAQASLNYLIAHQQADGGFSYTTTSCDYYCGSDTGDTAAALVAFQAAADLGLANSALSTTQAAALAYLLSTKHADGGFGNDVVSPSDGSSSAWALIALNTVATTDATDITTARSWLLADQNSDGGFSYGAYGVTASDTYTTAHAMVALLGTNWLLNPAPLTRPVVTPQPPTPVETTPPMAATTVSSAVMPVSSSPIVASAVPVETVAPVSQAVDATTTTTPSADPATGSAPPTVQPLAASVAVHHTTGRYVGYGLIIVAVVGWLGYIGYRRLPFARRSIN